MGAGMGDRRIREHGCGAPAHRDDRIRGRYTRGLAEQTVFVHVLLAALPRITIVVFNMCRPCVVVMRGWIVLVRMNLGPRDSRRDDQCRKYECNPAMDPGSVTVHRLSVPQVGRTPSMQSSGARRWCV